MYGALCLIPLFAFVVWCLNTGVAFSFPLLCRVKWKNSKVLTYLRLTKRNKLTQNVNVEDNTKHSTNCRVQSHCWEPVGAQHSTKWHSFYGKSDQYCVHKSPLRPLSWTRWIHFNPPTCSCTINLNPLNPELNPICYLLALLGAHHFLHVSRIRVKLLTFRLLMSYIYGAPILDVSRSHTTTQHSR